MTSESVEELAAGRRWWRLTAIGSLIALAATLAVTPTSANGGQMLGPRHADLPYSERVRARTVEADMFVLKDSAGRVRARMAVQGDAARLLIFDEDGKILAELPERARLKEVGK